MCFNHCIVRIRLLAKTKSYLSFKDLERVINAFVTSRLDYCNALYVGMDQASIKRLQLVQNAAARLLTGHKKRDHITGVKLGFDMWGGSVWRCERRSEVEDLII